MRPLRIALLTYRGNPHSGGQGVYVRHLSRELAALGHRVHVFSGPPYPDVDVPLTRLPALELFAEPNPFRTPALRELRTPADWAEAAVKHRGGFGEPLAFSLRAAALLRRLRHEFDVVHDNQGLGYGILATRLPVVATIHHPLAIDRDLKLAAGADDRATGRWYSFLPMQRHVARRLDSVVTVSAASRAAIGEHLGVAARVVPLGVDHRVFRPDERVERVRGRIVTTASADEPMKGLAVLLDAVSKVDEATLVVVGRPRPETRRRVAELGLADRIEFTSGLDDPALAALLASADVACVPSLFEGFSLPAAEALACATPTVVSEAGALPEVVGDAAVRVPPGDPVALADALRRVLGDAGLRERLAAAGPRQVRDLTWRHTAEATTDVYRRAIGAAC